MALFVVTVIAHAASAPSTGENPPGPAELGATLRVVAPAVVELELIEPEAPVENGIPPRWTFAIPASAVKIPAPSEFAVTVGGVPVAVRDVGLKRRVVSAPLNRRELRVGTWIYLMLEREIADGTPVTVVNPGAALWPAGTRFEARPDPLRLSPAIHVNQEGYLPSFAKQAMVGYFLGSAGELRLPATASTFSLVTASGKTVFTGRLQRRPDQGYVYSPTPYQEVWLADFSAFDLPGEYRLVVPGLGASLPFRIDAGIAMNFARAFALGIYHQRCGTDNSMPFTRFVHDACHLAPASVPSQQAAFPFTWTTLARLAAEAEKNSRPVAAAITSESAQLYPFVRTGKVDVSGGHHDAGDYGKYTTNSASFIHCLLFAVDSLPGVAELDNLGLPESGDGISDLLQEAKWEAEFLAKMQDVDGGFYFLVYPENREYESNVTPDQGDPQVVWPKNTAATAAAVAALAQASSSPHFRHAYPEQAAKYLAQAKLGWKFLANALARHGRDGAYQRLTHYGDNFIHDDELAWAACELFLATGEEEYHRKFLDWCDPASDATRRWGWWRLSESWGHAIRSYAFGARSGRVPAKLLDRGQLEKCEHEIELAGRDALRWSEHSAYGTSFPDETKRMRGGGWYFSLDQAFDLAVASQLDYPPGNDPRSRFLEAYLANLNYEGGGNPVNMSYVTGLGQRRQREVVHQYAQNDRRVLPPSGLPLGNLQTGQPYLANYRGELGKFSFPDDGAESAPYPFYDRWSDTYNASTEFVIVNQARALAGLAWLAAKTKAAQQPWRPVAAKITGLPKTARANAAVTAHLVVPAGLEADRVRIVWEARDQEPGWGGSFTFTPHSHGSQWVEAEAAWPDGRRVFAVQDFMADNGLPVVTVTTATPLASTTNGGRGIFRFHRTGDLAPPLTVRFDLRGDATKWNDYRRPEGDMPVEVTIPAGQDSVELIIVPVAASLGAAARHVLLELAADPAYNRASPHAAIIAVSGPGAPLPSPPPSLSKLPE